MNLKQKNSLLKVRGDINISVQRVVNHPIPNHDESELLREIYSPHPRYGWPANDLALQNSKHVPSEIRSALDRQNKMIPNNEVSSTDDDSVLDGVQRVNETDDEYALRVRNMYKDS